MKIDILTIFPKQVRNFTTEGIFRIAMKAGVGIKVHNLRDWTEDPHKTVDDRPFGGGPGMLLKVGPIYKAVNELKCKGTWVVMTGPRGRKLNSVIAKDLVQKNHILLICGHYEGVDERVIANIVDEEISIGDYVLSGGELPALVITDALLRHIPGVLGNADSLVEESFEATIPGEYPQYTRPAEFKGWKVPSILLSGDHKRIKDWRKKAISK